MTTFVLTESQAMPDSQTDPQEHFQLLIAALSEKIGTPLDASDGMVVLVNNSQALGMIIELSTDKDAIFVILPLLPFPDNRAAMGEIAMQALLLNADRIALNGACICADAHYSRYCLIRQLSLALDPISFISESEELTNLAGSVKEYLQLTDTDSENTTGHDKLQELMLKI